MDTGQLGETLSENFDDIKETVTHGSGKILAVLFLLYVLVITVVAWYWSREPELLDVQPLRSATAQPAGLASTQTLQDIVQVLLTKNGGYISNDILPPGVLMDDMPGWEHGVLIQVRLFTKVLKESMGRESGQLREDNDLVIAESRFLFDSHSWIIPSSESQYREGIEHLQSYQDRLQKGGDDKAVFIARVDNLGYWLGLVEQQLDSLSQRLSASVGPRQSRNGLVKTPRLKVDDNFYEARGTTWALIHLLKAAQIDFAGELKQKNATELLQQIILELEETQQPIRSPMILNGSGFGVLTNHSLVMASYISRSHAELIELSNMLAEPPVASTAH